MIQGKVLEAIPAPEREDDMETQEKVNLEQRVTFIEEKKHWSQKEIC